MLLLVTKRADRHRCSNYLSQSINYNNGQQFYFIFLWSIVAFVQLCRLSELIYREELALQFTREFDNTHNLCYMRSVGLRYYRSLLPTKCMRAILDAYVFHVQFRIFVKQRNMFCSSSSGKYSGSKCRPTCQPHLPDQATRINVSPVLQSIYTVTTSIKLNALQAKYTEMTKLKITKERKPLGCLWKPNINLLCNKSSSERKSRVMFLQFYHVNVGRVYLRLYQSN